MLSFSQFVEKAIESGIQNDSMETFFSIDGDQYTVLITSLLGREEAYPFEASVYLEENTNDPVWLVLYTEYEDNQINKYGIPLYSRLVYYFRKFYSTVVTSSDKALFDYQVKKDTLKLSEYGRCTVRYSDGKWKLTMEFRNGDTRTEIGDYRVI